MKHPENPPLKAHIVAVQGVLRSISIEAGLKIFMAYD
jgi:hypothetical protein